MFDNEDLQFQFYFTYEEYKAMSPETKTECYDLMYMQINNIAIDFGMPALSILDWVKDQCHNREEYEFLQIIKDFELYHSHNINKLWNY